MKIALSYWEKKHFWNNCDYTIVGSGITGLTSAIFIKKLHPKAKVMVLERGALPTGASTRNAGFACFGSAGELIDDLSHLPEREVFALVKRRFQGLQALRELLGDASLDYKHCGGYEIFTPEETEQYERVLGSLSYLNAEMVQVIGVQCYWDATSEVRKFGLSGIESMICNREEGIIDTGLMMLNLLEMARTLDIEIWNGVDVLEIEKNHQGCMIHTDRGELQSGFTVVATNGFAAKLLPQLNVKPCRGQVLVTSPIKGLDFNACFHHDRGFNYFRTIDGRILLGGGRQINPDAENSDELILTESVQEYLEGFLSQHILRDKKYTIDMRWSGIMGMGDSKTVIVEKIHESLGVAVRFGGMGVALGTQIGKEVAEWTL